MSNPDFERLEKGAKRGAGNLDALRGLEKDPGLEKVQQDQTGMVPTRTWPEVADEHIKTLEARTTALEKVWSLVDQNRANISKLESQIEKLSAQPDFDQLLADYLTHPTGEVRKGGVAHNKFTRGNYLTGNASNPQVKTLEEVQALTEAGRFMDACDLIESTDPEANITSPANEDVDPFDSWLQANEIYDEAYVYDHLRAAWNAGVASGVDRIVDFLKGEK